MNQITQFYYQKVYPKLLDFELPFQVPPFDYLKSFLALLKVKWEICFMPAKESQKVF